MDIQGPVLPAELLAPDPVHDGVPGHGHALVLQQQAQKLVEDNEITRRAQAYAVETRERAEKDADSIYNQACVQVDKMLSGAAAALSRSASELAALRDNLLTQGNNPQQDR